MKQTDKTQGWGGARPGSGRKTERKVEREKPFYLFADQVPEVTPEFVRAAVDEALKTSGQKMNYPEGQE